MAAPESEEQRGGSEPTEVGRGLATEGLTGHMQGFGVFSWEKWEAIKVEG